MIEPLVSIITPTYNHELYISQCIESVLAQSYENWEMIVVDDGSFDKTWEIVSSFCNRDIRIKAYHQENRGIWNLADTYNFGLSRARGSYVAILEGDDFWPHDKLSEQIIIHEQNPDVILSHGIVEIFDNNEVVGKYCAPRHAGKLSTLDYLRLLLLSESCIMPVSVVIKKNALDEIVGFHQAVDFPAVDFTTWLKIFQINGYVLYINKVLGYWRQSHQQVTKQLDIEIAEGCFTNAIKEFRGLTRDLSESLCLQEEDIIKARYRNSLLPTYLSGARIALTNRDKRKAQAFAKTLIIRGDIKRKSQGILVYLFSYCGWNIEWIFHYYEKLF